MRQMLRWFSANMQTGTKQTLPVTKHHSQQYSVPSRSPLIEPRGFGRTNNSGKAQSSSALTDLLKTKEESTVVAHILSGTLLEEHYYIEAVG